MQEGLSVSTVDFSQGRGRITDQWYSRASVPTGKVATVEKPPKHKGTGKTTKVYCKDNGKIYRSIMQAEKDIGLTLNTLTNKFNRTKKLSVEIGGYTFEIVR